MCAGWTLVNPALAHHHSSYKAPPLGLEGGTTGADGDGSKRLKEAAADVP
jgi:hypothetical protein